MTSTPTGAAGTSLSGWPLGKGYFAKGGTFDRVMDASGLYARRLGKSLSAIRAPGAVFEQIGGATKHLGKAFSHLQADGTTTSLDVLA